MKKFIIFLFSFLLLSSSTFPMLRKAARLRTQRFKKVLPRFKNQKRNFYNWGTSRKLNKALIAIQNKRHLDNFKNKELSVSQQKQLVEEVEVLNAYYKNKELSKLQMQMMVKKLAFNTWHYTKITTVFILGIPFGLLIQLFIFLPALSGMTGDMQLKREQIFYAEKIKIDQYWNEIHSVITKLEQEERETN